MRNITVSSIWMSYPAATGIVLLLGYFVLAIAVGGGSVYLGLHLFATYSDTLHHWILFIFFFFNGVLILISMVPAPLSLKTEGARIQPWEHPRLFASVKKLAVVAGRKMPHEIRVVPELNAFIALRGGFLGIGCQKVLGIGLPLLHILTVSQFEAVIAHEFGHYQGRHGRMHPLLHIADRSVALTVDMLSFGLRRDSKWLILHILRLPFVLYENLCVHIDETTGRSREFSADRFAAETVGSHACAGVVHALDRNRVFDQYLDFEVLPVVRSGYQPPLSEGFALYLQSGEKLVNVCRIFHHHPSPAERLAAIEYLPNDKPEDDSSALSLLDNVAELERRVLLSWTPNYGARDLKPISWDEVGERALIPDWEDWCGRDHRALHDLTLSSRYDCDRFSDVNGAFDACSMP